jgi:hypothetical protein
MMDTRVRRVPGKMKCLIGKYQACKPSMLVSRSGEPCSELKTTPGGEPSKCLFVIHPTADVAADAHRSVLAHSRRHRVAGVYMDHSQRGRMCLTWTTSTPAIGTLTCEQHTCVNPKPGLPSATYPLDLAKSGYKQYILKCKPPGITPYKGVCDKNDKKAFCDKSGAPTVCLKAQTSTTCLVQPVSSS